MRARELLRDLGALPYLKSTSVRVSTTLEIPMMDLTTVPLTVLTMALTTVPLMVLTTVLMVAQWAAPAMLTVDGENKKILLCELVEMSGF